MAEGLFGGRIALGEEIGRGAMGVVYKAVLNGSDVAVKVLHPHLTSDLAVVGRFVREHQALSRIDHPNVVRVIELVVDDPRLGIVMEHLDHPDLGRVIASGIDPRRAVRLANGIASGVAAIHDAKVAHRDLKPANVIVAEMAGDDGEVREIPKIADFGVSRLIGQSVVNASTTTLGTPLYMSPEATGGSTPIGQPADIYSLGVMLFEMLVGHPPYQAEEPIAVAVAHVNSPIPVLGGVPDQLSELLHSMLSKEAAARPDAATVAAALDLLSPIIPPDLQPTVLNEPSVDLSNGSRTSPQRHTNDARNGDETVAAYHRPPEHRSPATVLVAESNRRPASPLDDHVPGPNQRSAGHTGSFGYPSGNGNHGRESRPILGYAPPEHPGTANTPGGAGTSPPDRPAHSSYRPVGNRRALAPTTASSVRRTWLPFGLAALALLLIVPIGLFAWSRSRSGGADVEAGTTEAAFSFMPHLGANGLITTRRWELGLDRQGRRVITAEVIVANSGTEPVEAIHYEAFPEFIDAEHLVSTFRPEPDQVRGDPGVAIFEIGELAPRARFILVYDMLAPDNITSVEELQALAESQMGVEAAFLESLPARAAQEAMQTDGVLSSLRLSPSRLALAVGETASADLLGTLTDGTSVDPAALASAVWVVEDPSIAEITADNSIRGLRAGRTTVTVSVGEMEATLSLSVLTPEVAADTTTTTRSSTSVPTTSSSTTPPATSTTGPSSSTTAAGSSTSVSTTASSTTATSTTTPSSTTTTQEANLTMSALGVEVNNDGSFKITFTTNLCTIANYQGAGQSYITPGWPEVTGPCWESHGQNFTAVDPGSYDIVVRSRSAGGQIARRTTTVVIPEP